MPDCRAFEKISPAEKNNGDVTYYNGVVKASSDGDRAAFILSTSFGGGEAAPRISDYLSQRSPGGWSTRNIVQSAAPDVFGAQLAVDVGYRWFSPDLSIGLFARNDGPEIARNLHLRDFGAGESMRITPPPLAPLDPYPRLFSVPAFADATADGGHILFESWDQLTANAPAPAPTPAEWGAAPHLSMPRLYESVGGQVRLVGVMPDGSAAPGSIAGRGVTGGFSFEKRADRVMSEDGSRTYFTVPFPNPSEEGDGISGEVYLREAGETTHVSASQRTDCAGDPTCGGDGEPDPVPDPDGEGKVFFATASSDGSVVFLRSCRKLTDDAMGDCGSSNALSNLYRYDVAYGELENLTASLPSHHNYVETIEASDDGSTVYFVSATQVGGPGNVYMWRDGHLTHIGSLTKSANYDHLVELGRLSRVSSDGRFLLWGSESPVTGVDAGGETMLFLYDAEDGEISCVSCPADGSTPVSSASITGFQASITTRRQYEPRAMDIAGRWVFFETADALTPEDTNDETDVYQFDVTTGRHRLMSGGTQAAPAHLGDISRDGSSVLIVTAQRLSLADNDRQRDLYTARVGGGFPEPPSAGPRSSCEGDPCQGQVSSLAASLERASAVLRSRGNSERVSRPRLRIGQLSRVQRVRLARGGRVGVRLRVTGAGRVRLIGRAWVGNRSRVVARGRATARKAGTVTVRVRLSRSAQLWLASGSRLRVVLSLEFAGERVGKRLTLSGEAGK